MQFIIEQPNKRKYFCKGDQVIVFDSEQDAYAFAQNFYNFAHMEMMKYVFNGDPSIIADVQESSQKWKVIELPKDFTPKTINYYELRK